MWYAIAFCAGALVGFAVAVADGGHRLGHGTGRRGGHAMTDCPDAGYVETCLDPAVRCNWVACVNGCGLSGIGRCSARGDWRDP